MDADNHDFPYTRTRRAVLGEIAESDAQQFRFVREGMRITSTASSAQSSESFHLKRRAEAIEDVYDDNESPNCSTMGDDRIRMVPDVSTFYRTPGVLKFRRRTSLENSIDYFAHYEVPNEVLLNVFGFLNKRDLVNTMKTNRRFYQVGQSPELWQRVDVSNRSATTSDIYRTLRRGCKVLRMCGTMLTDDEPLHLYPSPETVLDYSVRLTHLDLSRTECDSLLSFTRSIVAACTELRCISLENHSVDDCLCLSLSNNSKLSQLDLSMVKGLTVYGLKMILTSCTKLKELNLSWCLLDAISVDTVCTLCPSSLEKLNLSGTLEKQAIVDHNVVSLCSRLSSLRELDLSDSPLLSRDALSEILSKMKKLETLSLSRCFGIHPLAFLQCFNIARLNIFGCVTEEGENTLRSRLHDTIINHSPFNHIARPTPPPSVTSIWGEKTKDLYQY